MRRSVPHLALDLLSAARPPGDLPGLSPTERRDLSRRLRSLDAWHLAGEITGFGLGPKVVLGRPTSTSAVRVYVREKRTEARLPRSCRVPRCLDLPGMDEPVLLDVVELPRAEHCGLRDKVRPIFPGISVGHGASGKTGTIGAFVRKAGDGQIYMLSALHVLADSGLAKRGDALIQPGATHGGSSRRHAVGKLDTWVALSASEPNKADAALGKLDPEQHASAEIRRCTHLAKRSDVVPYTKILRRVGCQSGEAPCVVTDMHFRTVFAHPVTGGRRQHFQFHEMLLYTGTLADGDSGGPLLTSGGGLVGIHTGRAGTMGIGTAVWSLPSEWALSVAE